MAEAAAPIPPEPVAAEILRDDPILGRLPSLQLSALLPHITQRTLAAGEPLYRQGEGAVALFLIRSGKIRVEGEAGCNSIRGSGYAGEEALLGGDTHTETAIATEPAEVLAIPAAALTELANGAHGLRERFFQSYIQRHEDMGIAAPPPAPKAAPRDETLGGILGWLLAIALPFAVLQIGPDMGLSPGATDFLAIIAVTVCMWLFGLVPEYVPPLFAALAVILLDVAPPEIALSGFRSESFFMCLSVFGLGALMVTSGITYRFSLWVLGHVPASSFGYNVSLFGVSALLSPVIPSILGRVVIVAPFLINLIEVSSAADKDRFANRLIYSLLCGASVFVPLFLTASVPNLVVFGLFDAQTQFAFDWLSWLYAASVYGVLVLLGFVLVTALMFRGTRDFSIPRRTVEEQRRVLGPISTAEWMALLAVLALILGILTEAIHQVDMPWVALAIFVALLLFGTIGRDVLRANVDWTILIYIGTIVGWVPIAERTGLETVIVEHLAWLGTSMSEDFPLFILMLSGLILLTRLALPTGVTAILFVTALFPLASAEGQSLWLIGFIVLAVADTFIFPYQSSYFLKLRSDLAAHGLTDVIDDRRIIAANVMLIALRIAAIYGCLVFWKYLDLI